VLLAGQSDLTTIPAASLDTMKAADHGSFTEGSGAREQLLGYASLASTPELGWFVIARQPASAAFASARSLAATIGAIGVLVAMIGVAAAVIIAGRVARPILRLTSKADRIGRDSTDMLPRVRGSLEVVQLSSALRSLLLRLGQAQQATVDLEARAA